MTNQDDQTRAPKIQTNVWLGIQALAGLSQWLDVFLIFLVPASIWHSGPGQIAMIASSFGLPGLVIGPIVGAVLDRSDPRRLLMCGAVAKCLLTAAIAFAPRFEIFLVLVLLKGLANVLYWPSTAVVTNVVVKFDRRVDFFSGLSMLDQCGKILTPLMAGWLGLLIGSQLVFLASACLMLIVALMLACVLAAVKRPAPVSPRTVRSLGLDFAAGLWAVKKLPTALLTTLVLSIGVALTLAIYDPHLASFLVEAGFDKTAYAAVVSATAAGAVFGAATVHFVYRRATPVQLTHVGVTLFVVAVSTAAALTSVTLQTVSTTMLLAIWFVNGVGYELMMIGTNVSMQNLCPRDMLGRISASTRSLQMLATVAGPGLGALLIESFSRHAPFVAATMLGWLMLALATINRLLSRKQSLSKTGV